MVIADGLQRDAKPADAQAGQQKHYKELSRVRGWAVGDVVVFSADNEGELEE
jgi:hypothetical protein